MKRVAIILCAGARDSKNAYCSRICCITAIKNALLIKKQFPTSEIFVLNRDIRTFGREYEECFNQAQDEGILFIRYAEDKPPRVIQRNGKLLVKVYHTLFKKEINLACDLVILSTPLVQHEIGFEVAKLCRVPLSSEGFFLEAHLKLRPVEFSSDGIYLCGSAQWPKDVSESISQAYAAASHASALMAEGVFRAEAITAIVNEDLCRGCGRCEEVCEFDAIKLEERADAFVANVNEVLCKGCGNCSVACPTGAVAMKHFKREQVEAMIKAL